jgi:hypothetical protein
MDSLRLDDAGLVGARPVDADASRPAPFMADVDRALAALDALRLYAETAGPDLHRDAEAMAVALSRLDAALGAAVRALHGAFSDDSEAA